MKSNSTLTIVFIFFILSLGIMSCQKETSIKKYTDIPELLERNEKIQLGKEWDFVQNFYAEQINYIKTMEGANEAKIKLAELFVKEARVTGEHGHYYPAALKLTDNILLSEKDSDMRFRTLITKAGVQLSLHEFSAALFTAQQALKLNSANAQVYGVLVDCYVELGEYEKAIDMADRMISIKPDIRSYSRISYLREIHGDYAGAIEAMTLAIKAGYPGYEETAWAMQTLGEMYLLYGETQKAEYIFKLILEERENYPFAIAALGNLQYVQGNFSASEQLTKDAINIIPEVGYYVQLAKLYKDQGRSSQVENLIEEIFVMLEDDVSNGHNMNLEYADLHLNLLDDPVEASKFAMLEFEKRPKNIDINRVLTGIFFKQGKIKEAEAYLKSALATNSKHPDVQKYLAASTIQKDYSSL